VKKSWFWQSEAPELKNIDEYIERHVIFSALKEDMGIVCPKAVEYVYIQMLDIEIKQLLIDQNSVEDLMHTAFRI